jgi:NAD-dependent deacetylase
MREYRQKYKSEIQQAGQMLKQCRYAVALAGAGISTPSGIPDFRTAESGLWAKHDPIVVANILAFQRRPQAFYAWVRSLVKIISQAQPNTAHLALAELERIGPLQAVITQNIDGLHTRSGSDTVCEVHGHVRELECLNCEKLEDSKLHLTKLIVDGTMPVCSTCCEVLKPKVVLFGELLPLGILNSVQEVTRKSDVMIIAGSSLEVAPVNELPWLAHNSQSQLIIVNFESTPIDHLADIIIRDDAVKVLPAIV